MNKAKNNITQEELTFKILRRIYNRGKRKGYVSPEYIEKTVKDRNIPEDKLKEVLNAFKEEGIKLMNDEEAALQPVVKKKRGRKKGSTNKKSKKNLDADSEEVNDGDEILGKTDDPVRMYLREMGGVELLSREGEIAIAKRIEASRSTMMVGIFGSPSSLKVINDWHKKIIKGDMLLREVIDCESTYNKTPEGKANVKTADNALLATSGKELYGKNLINENFEISPQKLNKDNQDNNNDLSRKDEKDKNKQLENDIGNNHNEDEVDEEFLSLTSIEEMIQPTIDKAFKRIKQIQKSFVRINSFKFENAISGTEVKDSALKKEIELIKELTNIFSSIILNNNAIEYLVDIVYGKNRKILSLENNLLKLSRKKSVNIDVFKSAFDGREREKNWFRKVSYKKEKNWKQFLVSEKDKIKKVIL